MGIPTRFSTPKDSQKIMKTQDSTTFYHEYVQESFTIMYTTAITHLC